MRTAISLSMVTLLGVGGGCVSSEGDDADEAEDGAGDTFLGDGAKADAFGVVEGSPEAEAVLRVANEVSSAELRAAKLGSLAIRSIDRHRLGADGIAGTADDDMFETLTELDEAPYVGVRAFERMLAQAHSRGWVTDSCGDSNVQIKDIYFEVDAVDFAPWRNCFTGTLEQTRDAIAAGAITGATLSRVTSTSLYVTHYQLPGREIELQRCMFTKADACTLSCRVTVQSAGWETGQPPLSTISPDGFIAQVDRKWRPLGSPVIDCQSGVYNVLQNTWTQAVTRADWKVLRQKARRGERLVFSGIAGVVAGGSHHPLQTWSAPMRFDVMVPTLYPEICDAGVEQITNDGEAFGAWCPWNIDIAQISCDGQREIADPRAESRYPLDLSAPSIQAYCGQ